MQLIKSLLAFLIVISLLPIHYFANIANEEAVEEVMELMKIEDENDLGAYYLINEDFSLPQPNTYSAVAPSGWDISRLGGALSVQGNRSFTVMDNSEKLPVIMNKKFNLQTKQITWEFTIKLAASMENTRFELRNGETVAVAIWIKEDGIYAKSSKEDLVLAPIRLQEIIGFKANVDIENNRYSLWVDGVKRVENMPFINGCNQLDNVNIVTGEEAVGSMDIGTVRISRGFIINERFLTSVRSLPDEWEIKENGAGIAPEFIQGALYPDVYSLKIVDNDFLNSSKISRSFEYNGEELSLEYRFMMPQTTGDFTMELGRDDDILISISSKKNQFGYQLKEKDFQVVHTLLDNLWYHVKLKLTKKGTEIYLNHKLVAQDIPLPYLKVNTVQFGTGKTSTGTFWLDDIIVKEIYPEPKDYVPEPILPEKLDYIVGMQSCNMWKEGSHFGWDWINPFPERHSYLGFYDEGSPEVKDWEIKWMLEHGIDYELFCWYRPPGGENHPIKFPRNAYALHEGFFNAKYSHMTKFAIAWENGGVGVSGSEDFRKNVVPFWMEYYFKDPRYLVIDNKPVIAIYLISGLKRAFGSVENIRAEMDYLRAACVEAGFDGAYILLTSSARTRKELEEIAAAGIDCIYNYSWGASAQYIENQMRYLRETRDAGGVDMMATMSMGRDDTPWERSSGGFVSDEEFAELVEWAKDEFIPSLPENSLGRRFVMFGNWNEYGEGHFLSPCNLNGFGYLDTIKRVFTKDSLHEDVWPTARQRERINRMYVQDRKKAKPFIVKAQETIEVPDTVKLGYYFDEGTEGWTVAKQVEDFGAKDGVMYGTSVDVDPGVYSPPDLGLIIGDVSHVRLRMRTDQEAASIVIYFITEESTNWEEAKKLTKSLQQIDEDFVELIIETSGVSTWKGKLKQMRLDPLTTPGKFEVESIELLSTTKEGELAVSVNDERLFFNRPIFLQNGVLMVPAAEISSYLDIAWETTLDDSALSILYQDKVMLLPYDSNIGIFDDQKLLLAEAACRIEDQEYFPLRSVAEALGYKIEWDSEKNMANVITSLSGTDAPSSVSYPPDTEGQFNFRKAGDLQGWQPNNQCNNVKVSNDVLSFQSVGSDPFFSRGVNWDASKYPNLRIRVKNQTPGTRFQMYFATGENPGLSESKSVTINLEPNSKEFKEYSVTMTSNSNWKGTITTLRLDPINVPGQFEIDYIIFTDQEEVKLVKGKNLIENGNMDSKNFIYSLENANAEYSSEQAYIGRYSLKVQNEKEDNALTIPVKLKQDTLYEYNFWIYLPNNGLVEVGTIDEKGEKTSVKTFQLDQGGIWHQITGSFTQGETVENAGLYISTDTKKYYVDGISLRTNF